MSITRRHILATIAAASVLGASAMAQAADTVRIGLPTKTYWPTTIAETAVRQKLFEKEGITAELTIYRGGAETFEAMAAGAADVILDATSLVSAGRKKGVNSKVRRQCRHGLLRLALATTLEFTPFVRPAETSEVASRMTSAAPTTMAAEDVCAAAIDRQLGGDDLEQFLANRRRRSWSASRSWWEVRCGRCQRPAPWPMPQTEAAAIVARM